MGAVRDHRVQRKRRQAKEVDVLYNSVLQLVPVPAVGFIIAKPRLKQVRFGILFGVDPKRFLQQLFCRHTILLCNLFSP